MSDGAGRRKKDATHDNVNHPTHYASGKIECIDAIDTVTDGLAGEHGYYTGTIIKYMWRWYRKNGLEDLRKAQWYLNRLIDKVANRDAPIQNSPKG